MFVVLVMVQTMAHAIVRYTYSDVHIFDNFAARIYLDAYARDKPALQIVATTHNYN